MPEDLRPEFGRRLRSVREGKGWTQAALAEQVDMATEAYARLERGLSEPRTSTLVAIARALEVSLDELVGLSGDAVRDEASTYRAESPQLHRAIRLLRRLPPRTLDGLTALLAALDEELDGG